MNFDNNGLNLLKSSLEKIKESSILGKNDYLKEKLLILEEKILKNQFQIVVLGQFKRGKTTLINALLGEEILPSAVIPLTSIITIIKYGPEEKIKVIYLDGKEEEIERQRLSEYITEKNNPQNQKKVAKVTIDYPSSYLRKGFEIIDTPGVDSIYEHNTQTSYQFIPQADAGIFVITADPPIGKSEIQFLLKIKEYLGKIFFVQNKIDTVGEKEKQDSYQFTKKVLEENLQKSDLKFYPLSAKLGLLAQKNKDNKLWRESGLQKFEQELDSFLLKEKGQIFILSLASKIQGLIGELLMILALEKQAINTPLSSLRDKITTFENELKNITQEKEDQTFIIWGKTEKLVKETLVSDIENFQEKQLPLLIQDFDCFYEKNKNLKPRDLSEKSQKFMEESLREIFIKWRKEEKEKIQETLNEILSRFAQENNKAVERVLTLLASIFEVKLEKINAQADFSKKSDFRFTFDEVPVELVIFKPMVNYLPKFISSKFIYQDIKKKIIEQFDRHCGRSRSDFYERIMDKVRDYSLKQDKVLDGVIKAIRSTLDKALELRQKNTKEAFLQLLQIEKEERSLDLIIKNISEMVLN